MVKLNKIYTRTGDDGTTGLATGDRIAKTHARVSAMGAVDETNAAIGLARLNVGADRNVDDVLARIQNDLFDLGADLATNAPDDALQWTPIRISPDQVEWLEEQIDLFNADIPALDSFILPAGTALSCHLHMARTICRRAEQAVAKLVAEGKEYTSECYMAYINRLSDLLFVLARHANNKGMDDVKWVPGGK